MSGMLTSTGRGPSLPAELFDALGQAEDARRAGDLDRAIGVLVAALDALRAQSPSAPLAARVMLALTLGDTYLAAEDRERARRVLLEESGNADRIYHLTRLSGTLAQARAAAAARLQVRDRAVQVELLGQEAPELDLAEWVHGEPTTLAALRGRVVLLEFWATWCRPCLEMFPRLLALQERHATRGLEILALTRFSAPANSPPDVARDDERALIRTVADDRGPGLRVGIAEGGTLQRRYGATGIPTLVLIDRAGRVRLVTAGGDETAIEAAITACLDDGAGG